MRLDVKFSESNQSFDPGFGEVHTAVSPVQPNWLQTDESAADFIKNKPVKPGIGIKSITWNGSTSGRVYKGVVVNSMPRYFVKVSDEILTPEDVNGAEHEFIDATESKQFDTVDTSGEDFHSFDNGWYFDTNLTTIAVAYEPNFTALAIKEGEVVLPEAGTYFLLHYYKAANLPNMYTTRLTYFRDTMVIDEGNLPKIPSALLPKAAAVPNVTSGTYPKRADFNNLLKALREAGYLAT